MVTTTKSRQRTRSSRPRRRAIEHYVKRRMFLEKLEDRRLLQGVPDWLGTDSFECGDPGCPLCCGSRENAEDWDTNDLRHRLGIAAPVYGPQVEPLEVTTLGTSDGWGESQDSPFFMRRELVIIDGSVADYKQLLTDLERANDRWAQIEALMIDTDVDGIAALDADPRSRPRRGRHSYRLARQRRHGAVGQRRLTAENLDQYADQIAGWRSALKPNSDILFYGCDLASSEPDGRSWTSCRS
jgi:hypothetical protein